MSGVRFVPENMAVNDPPGVTVLGSKVTRKAGVCARVMFPVGENVPRMQEHTKRPHRIVRQNMRPPPSNHYMVTACFVARPPELDSARGGRPQTCTSPDRISLID